MARRPAPSGPSLFDEPAAPTIAQTRVAPVEAAPRAAPTGKPVPTYTHHLCSLPDCWAWGSFGYYDGNISTSTWFCREHAPDDLRFGKVA